MEKKDAFTGSDFVIISTPTNYDLKTNYFNTSSVEIAIKGVLDINPNTQMAFKSTLPVGFTGQVKNKFGVCNILFCLEFLRGG